MLAYFYWFNKLDFENRHLIKTSRVLNFLTIIIFITSVCYDLFN